MVHCVKMNNCYPIISIPKYLNGKSLSRKQRGLDYGRRKCFYSYIKKCLYIHVYMSEYFHYAHIVLFYFAILKASVFNYFFFCKHLVDKLLKMNPRWSYRKSLPLEAGSVWFITMEVLLPTTELLQRNMFLTQNNKYSIVISYFPSQCYQDLRKTLSLKTKLVHYERVAIFEPVCQQCLVKMENEVSDHYRQCNFK